jgi:hypothetical protein
MEDSRGTLCRNRRLFGILEHLRCGWAGQDCEGGEGRERAGSLNRIAVLIPTPADPLLLSPAWPEPAGIFLPRL